MMLDIPAWGAELTSSAPTIVSCGSGSGIPDNIPDDDIQGMIDGFGFFQDKDELFDMENDTKDLFTPQTSLEASSPKVLTTNLPLVTNDTGAVVAVPELTISTPNVLRSIDSGVDFSIPEVTVSTQRDVISIDSKKCKNIALPQPPQLLTTFQNDKESVQSVLDQQRETILRNQKIIEAQKNELEGRNHQPIAVSPLSTSIGTKTPATYPLARAALKKADDQIINGTNTTKDNKRKASSPPSDETNAYKKWKLTPAGATKLKVVESTGIEICSNQKKHDDTSSKIILTPGELEIRRERNRKHAKKSRMRKKSLTSELEQSLEALREENTNLRKLIEAHIAKKKAAADSATGVETLLEKHRIRSHQRFIQCIIANSFKVKSKNGKRKNEINTKPYSGRGIVVNDKTLKVLKGLSKSITAEKTQKK